MNSKNYKYKAKYKTPTIKPLRGDIRRNVCDLVLGCKFLRYNIKSMICQRKKKTKSDFVQIKQCLFWEKHWD